MVEGCDIKYSDVEVNNSMASTCSYIRRGISDAGSCSCGELSANVPADAPLRIGAAMLAVTSPAAVPDDGVVLTGVTSR